ncbi:hypothetical protein BJ546DRAFT_677751 [Cryomyces antarcticus]|uniref:Uncharacterized protein n=1 Tax=Cryomyces antarcticus TaxID=329879 RepID=A0ABR0LPW0_9PEZI|nr:hypothetical protein LTR16_001957 [Cryomyces antarcticus]
MSHFTLSPHKKRSRGQDELGDDEWRSGKRARQVPSPDSDQSTNPFSFPPRSLSVPSRFPNHAFTITPTASDPESPSSTMSEAGSSPDSGVDMDMDMDINDDHDYPVGRSHSPDFTRPWPPKPRISHRAHIKQPKRRLPVPTNSHYTYQPFALNRSSSLKPGHTADQDPERRLPSPVSTNTTGATTPTTLTGSQLSQLNVSGDHHDGMDVDPSTTNNNSSNSSNGIDPYPHFLQRAESLALATDPTTWPREARKSGRARSGAVGGDRKASIKFSMGFREDCDLCRTKAPGHFNHILPA